MPDKNSELVDYSSTTFFKTYELNGMLFYAFFAQELYSEEDGLDSTGNYRIVLLHSSGQYSFTMYRSDGFWKIDEEKPFITNTIGKKIIQWLWRSN